MDADKLLVCLFVALVLGAGVFAHINQDLRLQIAMAEEARLDAMGCIGFVSFDPATMELVFVTRKYPVGIVPRMQ